MRPFALLLVVALAGCRTSDDSSGTQNPEVVTPVEVPAEMAAPDTVEAGLELPPGHPELPPGHP